MPCQQPFEIIYFFKKISGEPHSLCWLLPTVISRSVAHQPTDSQQAANGHVGASVARLPTIKRQGSNLQQCELLFQTRHNLKPHHIEFIKFKLIYRMIKIIAALHITRCCINVSIFHIATSSGFFLESMADLRNSRYRVCF